MSKTDGLRVGVLFGGRSVEHEVSVISARGVAVALAEAGMTCVPLAVTVDGNWLSPAASRRILTGGAARVDPPAGNDDGVRLAIEPGGRRLLAFEGTASPDPVALDVLFPLLHGWGGEDGRLQGALDLAGLPYVGAGVLGSALGMDKAMARRVFEARGLPVCAWAAFDAARVRRDPCGVEREVVERLGLPLFVKPSNGGSSVGISRVVERGALAAALELALAHDGEVVVERAVDAREIECAVLGNAAPEASGLGEIVPSREFYDYAAKYLDGTSELRIPAPLDEPTSAALRALALEAYRAIGLRGFARVDFLLDRRTGQAYLNEVNTLPGFTPISMFPKLWQAAGLAYPRLVARLVGLALEDREAPG